MEETQVFVNVQLNSLSTESHMVLSLQERCKETQIAKNLLKFTHSVLAVGKDDLVGRAGTLHQSCKGPFLAWSLNCWEDHGMMWVLQRLVNVEVPRCTI